MNQEEEKACPFVCSSRKQRVLKHRAVHRSQWVHRSMRMMIATLIFVLMWSSCISWPHVEAESSSVNLSDEHMMESWIAERLAQRNTMIQFKYEGSVDQFSQILTEVLNDALYSNPFIRYNVSRYTFHWKSFGKGALVSVYVQYRETYEQYQQVRQYAKEQVKRLVTPDMSEEQKVKTLHDFVVSQLAYDATMTRFTAYEAITVGSTVCQGYALLLQALYEDAGITSRVVEGNAGGQLHAWNMVQLDGQWYHVDATWNDPLPDKRNRILHTYYLLSDEEIGRDHTWDRAKFPQATLSHKQD
ncbi:transglutaminase domain-containing protein [Paenibacillus assamensis]|uniref:transglutaminase domain-containing protein n=1 Tax=Paenibacillus assamensis TaxID=311244 RepID=UPI00040A00A0|nr:transglutaminase domain-containing protein [Paenibacillus assamensis]